MGDIPSSAKYGRSIDAEKPEYLIEFDVNKVYRFVAIWKKMSTNLFLKIELWVYVQSRLAY